MHLIRGSWWWLGEDGASEEDDDDSCCRTDDNAMLQEQQYMPTTTVAMDCTEGKEHWKQHYQYKQQQQIVQWHALLRITELRKMMVARWMWSQWSPMPMNEYQCMLYQQQSANQQQQPHQQWWIVEKQLNIESYTTNRMSNTCNNIMRCWELRSWGRWWLKRRPWSQQRRD